jgi:hypothetical protein
VRNVSDVRLIEVHTAEPLLVPGPSCLEVEIAIGKWKKYKSSGSAQIAAELHKLVNFVWNKEELPCR